MAFFVLLLLLNGSLCMKRSLGYAFGNTDETLPRREYYFPVDQYLDLDVPSLYHSWSWAVLEQDTEKIRIIEQATLRKGNLEAEVEQLVLFSGQPDLIGFFGVLFGMSFENLKKVQKEIIIRTSSCSCLRRLFDFRYVPIDMDTFKLISGKPSNFTTPDDFVFIISHLAEPFSHEHVLVAMGCQCPDVFLWLMLAHLKSCHPDVLRASLIMQRSLGLISAITDLTEYVESDDITMARVQGFPEEILRKLRGKRIA